MKGKTLLCLALVTSMLLGVFIISPVGAQSTTIGVEPSSIVDLGLGSGSTFTVNITIRNVTDLAAFEFYLGYDTSVLNATLIEYGGIFTNYLELGKEIYEAEGWLHYAVMVGFGQPSFNGSGTAAIIHFTVDSLGESDLDLYDTLLGAPPDPEDPLTPIPIPHSALGGYFRNVRQWTLNIESDPITGVNFTIDGVAQTTSWSSLLNEGSHTVVMPLTWTTGTGDVYQFDHWEDASTDPTRTVSLTSNTTITAYYVYVPETYTLTINADPISGVGFTVDGALQSTPWTGDLAEGSHTIVMPSTWGIYDFDRWENMSTNPTRVIDLNSNMTITAYYLKRQWTLNVNSDPIDGVEFTLDDVTYTTPWSSLLDEGSYTVVMPSTLTVGTDVYSFDHWEDTSTAPSRVMSLTSNVSITAYYEFALNWTLTVNSDPITGVEFAVDGATQISPWTGDLMEGPHIITMPATWTTDTGDVYNFDRWEDASTDPNRTISLIADMTITAYYSRAPTIGVEPQSIVDLVPGSAFTVEIWIRNVTDLQIFDFKLRYNTTVLNATSITYGGIYGANKFEWAKEIWDDLGWLGYAASPYFGDPTFTGDGIAAILNFTVESLGESDLDLYDTELRDPENQLIAHELLKGYFSNVRLIGLVHDIAVTNVVPSPTEVTAGENVTINVTVKNEGDFNETFDVTVYYGNIAIDTETVSLENGTSTTLTFTWDTTDIGEGPYTIKAEAILDLDDDTDDNTGEAGGQVTVREAAPAPNILIYVGVAAAVIAVVAAAAIYIVKIRKRA